MSLPRGRDHSVLRAGEVDAWNIRIVMAGGGYVVYNSKEIRRAEQLTSGNVYIKKTNFYEQPLWAHCGLGKSRRSFGAVVNYVI